MEHHFNVSVAQKIGVNEAIFLQNMAFWIQKNKANNRHLYEGRYWTYNSQKSFSELFPYWSRQTIRTIIHSCIKHNLIIIGNFNKAGYDRTTWYSFTDSGADLFSGFNLKATPELIGGNQPMEWLEPTNGMVETNQPIPDSKTHIVNTDVCATHTDDLKYRCVGDPENQKLFAQKFANYDVCIDDLFAACYAYHKDKTNLYKFRQWIAREEISNYKAIKKALINNSLTDYQEYVGRIKTDIQLGVKKSDYLILTYDEWLAANQLP